MKHRQHRQQAAPLRRGLAAPAPAVPAPAPVDSQSVAGEEDPGAAMDGLVSPPSPVPGADQAPSAPHDDESPPG